MEEEVQQFEIPQIADYARHILYLNLESYGSEFVEVYVNKLDKLYLKSAWDTPNFAIYNTYLDQVNSIIMKLDFEPNLFKILYDVIVELKSNGILEEEDSYIASNPNQGLIRLSSLISILTNINDDTVVSKMNYKIRKLKLLNLNLLNVFRKEVNSSKYTFQMRFLLTLFYLEINIFHRQTC